MEEAYITYWIPPPLSTKKTCQHIKNIDIYDLHNIKQSTYFFVIYVSVCLGSFRKTVNLKDVTPRFLYEFQQYISRVIRHREDGSRLEKPDKIQCCKCIKTMITPTTLYNKEYEPWILKMTGYFKGIMKSLCEKNLSNFWGFKAVILQLICVVLQHIYEQSSKVDASTWT